VCVSDPPKKNCAYNGSALPLDDEGVEELKQWCSHLLPNDYPANSNVSTCCDIEQVSSLLLSREIFRALTLITVIFSLQLKEFNSQIKLAAAILNRCPSCMTNLARHICDFTCSPRQSEFIKVKKTAISPENKSKYYA
jgi:Niemann-Pick C1 protein